VKEQLLVLPCISVDVLLTVVVPTVNILPEEGVLTTVALPQLSVAVTLNVTIALQLPIEAFWKIADGQVISGLSLSLTVTVKLQPEVLPLKSVAVPLTVVVPTVNVLPETGLDTTVALQLSVAVTLNVTTALQFPLSVF
jgi:hypothetical protein